MYKNPMRCINSQNKKTAASDERLQPIDKWLEKRLSGK